MGTVRWLDDEQHRGYTAHKREAVREFSACLHLTALFGAFASGKLHAIGVTIATDHARRADK
jgi:hypothetical protein